MTGLLLIDLDGTARITKSGQVCPTYPDDQILIPETANLCQQLADSGWTISAVTNQGGCEAINRETGKPYKTHRQAVDECKYFLDIAPWSDRVYMCPNGKGSSKDEVYRVSRSDWLWQKYWVTHRHNDDHPYFQTIGYRKPKPGMLELAIKDETESEYAEARALGIRERDMVEINVRSLMVGDMESDRMAAKNAGVAYLSVEEFQQKTRFDIGRLIS
ncbi:histidinol phosphatase [Leptolyngbya sp. PCC 7375]|nr:histidinol phosphatase [Leptolyngbya sp. PCC 7375]